MHCRHSFLTQSLCLLGFDIFIYIYILDYKIWYHEYI
jgi:hypothetical protein